jgi:hypothetical protein
MEENNTIDQSLLAEDVSSKIKYNFFDFFLVKPLDPIKVTKEFSKPVTTGTPTKDENGIEAQDYDKVETEVKEVNSDYRRGIVLKRPVYYEATEYEGPRYIEIGSTVIFRDAAGMNFDLVKDSKLLRQYDILGIEK